MSPLCAAVFQGTWSVFSHNEINNTANCAAASGGGGGRGEDRADQTGHIVRSLSLIYLCALCDQRELCGAVALTCDYWNEILQTTCNIDTAYLNLFITIPEEFPKFLFTLLSQIFSYSDLSQPIGTLAWTGQFYWFPIPSWHNKDCQRTTETCPWLKCNSGCYITSTLELLPQQELVQGATVQWIKSRLFFLSMLCYFDRPLL